MSRSDDRHRAKKAQRDRDRVRRSVLQDARVERDQILRRGHPPIPEKDLARAAKLEAEYRDTVAAVWRRWAEIREEAVA